MLGMVLCYGAVTIMLITLALSIWALTLLIKGRRKAANEIRAIYLRLLCLGFVLLTVYNIWFKGDDNTNNDTPEQEQVVVEERVIENE